MSMTTTLIRCVDFILVAYQTHSHAQTVSFAPLTHAGKYNGIENLHITITDGH